MKLRSLRTLAVLPLAFAVSHAVARNDAPRAHPSDPTQRSTWIVTFEDAPLAAFTGSPTVRDAKGNRLAATAPEATGARRLDVDSAASRAYVAWLDARHAAFLAQAKSVAKTALAPKFRYRYAANGMALELTEAQAHALQSVPGVAAVTRDFERRLMTDTTPAFIGADRVWAGTVFESPVRTQGEGVVVGIVDSGINAGHPAFADVGADNYNHTNPRGRFYGLCQTSPGCNDKLIGIYDYTDEGARDGRDLDGHGSHVASTAAGAPNNQTIAGASARLSGIAPHANIISYKVCRQVPDSPPRCSGAGILAAVEQALVDQVDVLNLSLGSDTPFDPWFSVRNPGTDDAGALLNARAAGTVVAVAAGNSGPEPGTIGSPGNAPWVLTVANTTEGTNGDRINGTSSRGPGLPFGGWVKPDLAAPGTDIYAASATGSGFAQLTGTSMASPHIAGSAALLRAAFPSFTVSQIESSLTTTAKRVMVGGVNATAHDAGSGRVVLTSAVKAPLTLEVTRADFVAADPTLGGRPETLNRPSFADENCVGRCRFTRVAKAEISGEWRVDKRGATTTVPTTVTPASTFTLTAGQTQEITVEVDVSGQPLNEWIYGGIALVPVASAKPETLLPLAVRPTQGSLPELVEVATGANAGAVRTTASEFRTAPNFVLTTTALVQNAIAPRTIPQDPTTGDPFDSPTGVEVFTLAVPAQAAGERGPFVVVTLDSPTAPDMDLFVGLDDGSPSAADVQCVSAGSTAKERCVLELPASTSARSVFALVQNFTAGASGADVANLAMVAPTPGATGRNLVATGPGHTTAGTAFTIQTAWNEPRMLPGDTWVGLIEAGPDATQPRGFGAIPVIVQRTTTNAQPAAAHVLDPTTANKSVTLDLAPGAAHERLVVDVPANATSLAVTTSGSGEVDLYVAKSPAIDATQSTIAAAPARGAALGTSIHAGATERVDLLASGAPALTPGRWYVTPVNAGTTRARVTVTAEVALPASSGALPLLPWRQTAYFNPSRSGHGVFLSEGAGQRVLIWYTYEVDGAPTWYLAQGPVPDARVGSIWSAPLLRFAWNGASAAGAPVGEAILTRTAQNAFTYSWRVDGTYGSENMVEVAQPTCPRSTTDYGGTWYAPAQSGFGYSVLTPGNTEVEVAYLYDDVGNPRWLYAQGDPSAAAFDLLQFRGFCPTCPTSISFGTAGTLTRTFANAGAGTAAVTATLLAPLAGAWTRANEATVKLTDDLTCP
jgi:subtilisin family serine protease